MVSGDGVSDSAARPEPVQPPGEPRLAAGGGVLVEYAALGGLVQKAQRFGHCALGHFYVATFHRPESLRYSGPGGASHTAVPLCAFHRLSCRLLRGQLGPPENHRLATPGLPPAQAIKAIICQKLQDSNRGLLTGQGYRIWILANWDRMLMRKLSSQPARFSLPRMESLPGSSRAGFSASLRSKAKFSAQCPFRFRAWSSLQVASNTHFGSPWPIQQPVQGPPMPPHDAVAPLLRPSLAQQVVAGFFAGGVIFLTGCPDLAHGLQTRPVMPLL